jgi:signal transduction histidine kinase
VQTVPRSPELDAELFARLESHRTIGGVPREELAWLVAHGAFQWWEAGEYVARKGELVDGLFIVLSGQMSHLSDQGGSWRRVVSWRAGDVTGALPYSRLVAAPGNSLIDERAELLTIPRTDIDEMIVACPHTTGALVHAMIDRVRAFKSSDLQFEKLASLGKLAAGLAHELNNPAAAAVRGAQEITRALVESDAASRALGATLLTDRELAVIARFHDTCLASSGTTVRTPLERADREAAFEDWLTEHDIDESLAGALAETDLTFATLDELAAVTTGEKLRAALQWVAAGCTVRSLARQIDRSASRVHELVSAIKGFTYMDQAKVAEPMNMVKGLEDTIAVLASKARKKSASLTLDMSPDLPRVRAIGGELNQVWANLVDNALDAVSDGGRVSVTARAEGSFVVVRVTDDGPGIPAEIQARIFEPFFTTKPVGKGTGLGLDIARRLVEQNDGLLVLESQPTRTEFKVSLPVVG